MSTRLRSSHGHDSLVPALEADLCFVLTNLPGTIIIQVSVPRDRLKLCVGVLCFPLVVPLSSWEQTQTNLVRTPSFRPLCVMLCCVCVLEPCFCIPRAEQFHFAAQTPASVGPRQAACASAGAPLAKLQLLSPCAKHDNSVNDNR